MKIFALMSILLLPAISHAHIPNLTGKWKGKGEMQGDGNWKEKCHIQIDLEQFSETLTLAPDVTCSTYSSFMFPTALEIVGKDLMFENLKVGELQETGAFIRFEYEELEYAYYEIKKNGDQLKYIYKGYNTELGSITVEGTLYK